MQLSVSEDKQGLNAIAAVDGEYREARSFAFALPFVRSAVSLQP
jgi:hypothetical protein